MLDTHGVLRALESHDDYDENEESIWTFVEDILWEKKPVEWPRLGTVTLVNDHGGEGMGDLRFMVIRVQMCEGSDRLFRKDGFYSSYCGTDWDGHFREVRAVEKTVTVYE